MSIFSDYDPVKEIETIIYGLMAETPEQTEMRRELDAARREEARIENAEYKEECREEKIDW